MPPSPADMLQERVRVFLERHAIHHSQILVSLSGGADSTALLRLLCQLREEFQLTLHAAHFDHGLRPESVNEARWVTELCQALNVNVYVEKLEVTQVESIETATGIEERARTLRYAKLERLAESLGCGYVATGHTSDDQVETMLQRLLRGTGLWGLTGIRESRPLGSATLLRPLLPFRRNSLEAFLRSLQQSWLEDDSNRDLRWTRNRIRHELLPYLREHFNSHVEEHFVGLSKHVRDVMAFVEHQASLLLDETLLESQPGLQKWDADRLGTADEFLCLETLRLQWRSLAWSEVDMTRLHWESLSRLVTTCPPSMLSLPGNITATRRGNLLVLEQKEPRTQ